MVNLLFTGRIMNYCDARFTYFHYLFNGFNIVKLKTDIKLKSYNVP